MGTCGGETVDKIKCIAGHTSDINDLLPNGLLDGAVNAVETVEAGVLVREGGAHPRLGVVHLPLERNGSEVPELRHGACELVGGVRQLLNAVVESRPLFLVARPEADEAGSEGGDVVGPMQADGDGGEGYVVGGLGGAGDGGEGVDAEGRVLGVSARVLDELVACGVGFFGGSVTGFGGESEEREEEEKEGFQKRHFHLHLQEEKKKKKEESE
ncbi:hypothetical protein AAC387_Pa01g1352 [Persea americana]